MLLEFEEVRRRLQLGTRRDIGVREIRVDQIIGSVSRAHEFDGCFRPQTTRLRKLVHEIRQARPNAADTAILVYQVDHAYFVVDGHKRLSLAFEEGRELIDAEVGRFASSFHVAKGTTMADIRATERERAFRKTTGLELAVPEARFPLSDFESYLDLEESVKAHSYDLSRDLGRVVEPAEGARHWYDFVYRPVVKIALDSGVRDLLSSCTDADHFLLVRSGSHGPMEPGWQIAPAFVEKSRHRIRAAAPKRVPATIARVTRRGKPRPTVLPASDIDAIPGDGPTTDEHGDRG
ncbi:MAG TPA: hypothetical protein VF253_07970 [Candidatus Limnocylindrales bacterium]